MDRVLTDSSQQFHIQYANLLIVITIWKASFLAHREKQYRKKTESSVLVNLFSYFFFP
jgi:hypothetical protein